MITRSATPMPSAPPLPPSPITAATIGTRTRVGAWSVDEADDREAELGGVLRKSHRLAVALGMHHPPVPRDPLFEAPSLLMAEEHRRAAVPRAHAPDQCGIVGGKTVAVQLDEVRREPADVVQRVGPAGVARELDHLPHRQRRLVGSAAVPRHGYISRRWASKRLSSVRDTTMSTWPRASWNSAL